MSSSILENFQKRIEGVSDDELIAMGSININQYQKDVVDLIKNEIKKRGVQGEVQEVFFDLFANVNDFAGRLILLEEQLLFLSTGMPAKLRGSSLGGGIAGGLASGMRDADIGQQSAFAAALDFSGLENAGSWICYLDEIVDCETESSWLSGKKITIRITDEETGAVVHSVKCDELPKPEFTDLKIKIENAKNRFMQLQK